MEHLDYAVIRESAGGAAVMQKPPKKKYKCPYCDQRLERQKLSIHIQNEHEDLIPEGYTALRVAFNAINNKTEGHCIICKSVTDWNEDKGRYERLCNNPACHEAYKKMAAERNKRIYGTDRLQTDPQYAEIVQKKALAGRKMAGKYKFADGGEVQYLGTYERKLLEFMDKVMNCESEDIIAPGPSIKYMYEGKEHLYIPDFYYEPYELIIEIKDGGDNPNTHPKRIEEEKKNKAKEEAVRAGHTFNYVRVVNNDFGQLLSIMAAIKFQAFYHKYYYPDPIVRSNESAISESLLVNEKDIYYNKDKFDSGEINLCFIVGHSGSGKSTMAHGSENVKTQVTEMDDLFLPKDRFSIDDLKRRGDLIYSFFNGPGKKYYTSTDELDKMEEEKGHKTCQGIYVDELYKDFVNYAKQYARSHTNCKYIVEGIAILINNVNNAPLFSPAEFKDYAFYIKGTSMLVSKFRQTRRDQNGVKDVAKNIFSHWILERLSIEKSLNRFRSYFENLMKTNESAISESLLVNEKDIYYNKDKFDSGEINLCFITGHSGSGKSTMAHKAEGNTTEAYELDDLYAIKDHFTMDQLKEYGDLIYSYFKGPGKQFYLSNEELNEQKIPESDYEDKMIPGFVHYAMNYAKTHKNKKFIVEGVYLFNDKWFTPSEFKDYAFYIKGTSLIISKLRAAKRDSSDAEKHKGLTAAKHFISNSWKAYNINEKKINRFRDYFENLMKASTKVNEDMSGTIGAALPLTPAPMPHECDKDNYYIIQHPENNVFAYGITKDPVQNTIYGVDPLSKGFYKAYKTDKGKINKEYLTFKVKDSQSAKELYDELANLANSSTPTFHDNRYTDSTYLYSRLTEGSEVITPDQLLFDSRFELVRNPGDEINHICQELYNYLKGPSKDIDVLKEQINLLEDFDTYSDYNVMPYDICDVETLAAWKSKFDAMPYEMRIVSNDLSTEMYGANNLDRYNQLYADLMNNVDPNTDLRDVSKDNDKTEALMRSIDSVSEASTVSSDLPVEFYDNWDNKLKKVNDAETQGLVIMVLPDTEDLNYTEDSITALKAKWDKLQSLPEDKRVLSGQTASSIFGIDNDGLYHRILNLYITRFQAELQAQANGKEDIADEEKPDPSVVVGTNPVPYFTPGENQGDYISSKSDILKTESGEIDYKRYSQVLTELSMKLSHTSNKDKRELIKNEIYALGWNPEIPYTEESAKLANLRYQCFSSIQELNALDVLQKLQSGTDDIPMKFTSEYLKDKIVPVFVTLFHGEYLHSKGIMWFTDSEWSHVTLSFDSSLDRMYTFTGDTRNTEVKPTHGGFMAESREKYKLKDKNLKIKVYALFVTPEQRDQMEEAVQWYINHQDETRYNFKGIFNIFLRRVSKKSGEDKCKMICSQFVYTILNLVNFRMKMNKSSSLVTPGDIDKLSDDSRFYVVYEGAIGRYNSGKVDEICYKLLPALPTEMYGIEESSDMSKIDKDHKQLGKKSLSDFEEKVGTKKQSYGESVVVKWYDGKTKVAEVMVDKDPASDGYRYFGSLEVNKDYRGYGLGEQIVRLCVDKYKAGALAVAKDNQIAYNLYKKIGFQVGKPNGRDKSYYYMYYKKNCDKSAIKESMMIDRVFDIANEILNNNN